MEEFDFDEAAQLDAQRGIVYKEFKRLGMSYAGEIADNTGLPYDAVRFVISKLAKDKLLVEYVLKPKAIHPLLKRRFEHFWGRGMFGYDQFARKHWYHPKLREPTDAEVIKILAREKHGGKSPEVIMWSTDGDIIDAE